MAKRRNPTRTIKKPSGVAVSDFTPLVSIIIPNFKRYDLLQKCLNSIPGAFGCPYEVIIVENGTPTEDRQQFYATAQIPPHTRTKILDKNIGFPAACNLAATSMAKGALLFFLNNDVVLDPGSGDSLVSQLDDPEVGVAGMKLCFPSEEELSEAALQHSEVQRAPGRIQHVGLAVNLRVQVFHLYLGWRADNPRVQLVRDVFAVTGAALLTRRSLFYNLKGFDPMYGMGTYEDVDYCMKVTQSGRKIVVDQKATGIHYTGSTAEKYQMAFPLNDNRMKFEQKWYNKLVWDEWRFQ